MSSEQALCGWLARRLQKDVEERMRDVHTRLRRGDSDEPAPQLLGELEPRTVDRLSETPVRLTIHTGAQKVVPLGAETQRVELMAPQRDFSEDWLLDLERKEQFAVIRNARTGALRVAARAASKSALIEVLRKVMISRGRPTRITCDRKVVSVIDDWARLHGIEAVARRHSRRLGIGSFVNIVNVAQLRNKTAAFLQKGREHGTLDDCAEAERRTVGLGKKPGCREILPTAIAKSSEQKSENVSWAEDRAGSHGVKRNESITRTG